MGLVRRMYLIVNCLLLFHFFGLASEFKKTSLVPAGIENLLLVKTVNGILYAMNAQSGALVWSRGGDNERSGKSACEFKKSRVLCGSDGAIYYVDNLKGQFNIHQKLTMTIQELVKMSPFVFGNLHVTGSKKSRLLRLDISSGQSLAKKDKNIYDEKSAITVIETKYKAKAAKVKSFESEWVLSLTEIDIFPAPKPSSKNAINNFSSDIEGRISYLDEKGKVLWKSESIEPVVAAYQIDPNGDLREVKVAKEFEFEKERFLTQRKNLPHAESPSKTAVKEFRAVKENIGSCEPVSDLSRISSSNESVVSFPELSKLPKLPEWKGVEVKSGQREINYYPYIIIGLILLFPLIFLGTRRRYKKKYAKRLKFEINWKKILGKGSNGTIVYEGVFDGRKVAVKRILKGSLNEIAEREIDFLLKLDNHPNVLRYFASDEDENFIYIALEKCQCNLWNIMKINSQENMKMKEKLNFLKDENLTKNFVKGIFKGLDFLHSKNVVHRDIKPQNILISDSGTAKVADMGISKLLECNQTSFQATSVGSSGWQPKETLEKKRQTPAVDAFSLGCVLYFILAQGRHPFGEKTISQVSLIKEHINPHLSALSFDPMNPPPYLSNFSPEAIHLTEALLHPSPEQRVRIGDALLHPFFWDEARSLAFLCAVSNRVEKEPLGSPLRDLLESRSQFIVRGEWNRILGQTVMNSLGKFRRYDFRSVRDLLRVVRNKAFHYAELPLDVKREVGALPREFYRFFASRFPRLFLYSYLVVGATCGEEGAFSVYFGRISRDYMEKLKKSALELNKLKEWYPVFSKKSEENIL